MSKADDMYFTACQLGLVKSLRKHDAVHGLPTQTPKASDDALEFLVRVAEAEFCTAPFDSRFSRSVFEKVYSSVADAAAYWFGGESGYIRRNPKESKLDDAQSLTVPQLMEKHGISRSYAFQLKKEARKRAQ